MQADLFPTCHNLETCSQTLPRFILTAILETGVWLSHAALMLPLEGWGSIYKERLSYLFQVQD